MTVLLALIGCLLVGLLINQVSQYHRLKRQIQNLSARLDRQNEFLARLTAAAERSRKLRPALVVQSGNPEVQPPESGPSEAEQPAARPPSVPLASRPEPAPGRAGSWFGPEQPWPTLTALLVLIAGTGFLVWFSLSLGRFSPALRLGAVILAGLTSLTLGLLIRGKYPRPGLAAEGCGLWVIGLALAAARFYGFLALGPARAALIGLGLFGTVLALKQNSPRLTTLILPAFFGLWATLTPDWAALTPAAAGAGLFYLALAIGLPNFPSRRPLPYLALASLNLALVSRLLEAPPEPLSTWAALSWAWTLEGVILLALGRRRLGLLALAVAAAAAGLIPDRFSEVLVSQFFLAVAALGGALIYAATRPFRPIPQAALFSLGLGIWLAGSLVTVWGAATAFAEPSAILNWLLAAWSLLSFGLWLAGRAAPDLLCSSNPGSPSLLVLAQMVPLVPALALALGFLWPLLRTDFNGSAAELNPAAWALWALAQSLGLAQARPFVAVSAWSNVFLLVLALVLGQAAAVLAQAGPPFGQDLARLAALFGVLVLLARPPRLAFFQEPGLCRIAGLALGGLVLWRGLILALDPADRPGFLGFLPVFNLTDLAQAATFWLPVAFLRRLAFPARYPALDFLQGALFFFWLNLVLARAIHHLTGVPYQPEALFASQPFRLACIGVWSALGLGFWLAGRRRRGRTLEEAGENG